MSYTFNVYGQDSTYYNEIIKSCNKVLKSYPSDPVILETKGIALLNINDKLSAKASLLRSYEIDSLREQTIYCLAFTYNALEIFDSALFFINKAISISPQNPSFYSLKGNIYLRKSDYQSALKQYEQYLLFDGKLIDIVSNLSLNYALLNEFDKSINLICSIEPSKIDHRMLYVLGYSYTLKQDFINAIKAIRKAESMNKVILLSTYYRAFYHKKKGNHKKSCDLFSQIDKKDYKEIIGIINLCDE